MTVIQLPLAAERTPTPQRPLQVPTEFASQGDVVLEFRGVTKTYSGKKAAPELLAVSDVSLQVRRGEVLCLMGTSGSGKSTLLRHINRLIEPTSGDVLIDGQAISGLNDKCFITEKSLI